MASQAQRPESSIFVDCGIAATSCDTILIRCSITHCIVALQLHVLYVGICYSVHAIVHECIRGFDSLFCKPEGD